MEITLDRTVAFKHPDWEADFHIWNQMSTEMHNHHFFELFVVLEGNIAHYINGKKELLSVGNLRFIRPSDFHSQQSVGELRAKTINICFTPQFKEECAAFNSTFSEALDSSGIPLLFRLNEKEFPYVDFLTECILQAKNDQEEINLIRQFIVLCSNHIPANTDRSEKRPDWFNDFLLRVNDPKNFSQPVNQLYRYVNYSSSMLSILFKKYMNMTLVQYFTDVKIKYACNLLRNTNYSTLSIANDIGFFSLSHFNHVFKEHVHLTPAQYRQSYQPKDKRKLH